MMIFDKFALKETRDKFTEIRNVKLNAISHHKIILNVVISIFLKEYSQRMIYNTEYESIL